MMETEAGGADVEDRALDVAPPADAAARARAAGLVRQHAEQLTQPDVQALAYWMRPQDVGLDHLSEFVGAGFRRLAHDLALAIETDIPELVCDDIVWLVRLLDRQGYDPRQVTDALHIFEAALAALCPPEVTALARPILGAGHQAALQTVAELHPEGLG